MSPFMSRNSVVFPQFSGENPADWLYAMEDIFEELQVPMEKFVNVAIPCLRGAALAWGFYNAGKVLEMDWCAFSYNLLWEFDPSSKEPQAEELAIVGNHYTLDVVAIAPTGEELLPEIDIVENMEFVQFSEEDDKEDESIVNTAKKKDEDFVLQQDTAVTELEDVVSLHSSDVIAVSSIHQWDYTKEDEKEDDVAERNTGVNGVLQVTTTVYDEQQTATEIVVNPEQMTKDGAEVLQVESGSKMWKCWYGNDDDSVKVILLSNGNASDDKLKHNSDGKSLHFTDNKLVVGLFKQPTLYAILVWSFDPGITLRLSCTANGIFHCNIGSVTIIFHILVRGEKFSPDLSCCVQDIYVTHFDHELWKGLNIQSSVSVGPRMLFIGTRLKEYNFLFTIVEQLCRHFFSEKFLLLIDKMGLQLVERVPMCLLLCLLNNVDRMVHFQVQKYPDGFVCHATVWLITWSDIAEWVSYTTSITHIVRVKENQVQGSSSHCTNVDPLAMVCDDSCSLAVTFDLDGKECWWYNGVVGSFWWARDTKNLLRDNVCSYWYNRINYETCSSCSYYSENAWRSKSAVDSRGDNSDCDGLQGSGSPAVLWTSLCIIGLLLISTIQKYISLHVPFTGAAVRVFVASDEDYQTAQDVLLWRVAIKLDDVCKKEIDLHASSHQLPNAKCLLCIDLGIIYHIYWWCFYASAATVQLTCEPILVLIVFEDFHTQITSIMRKLYHPSAFSKEVSGITILGTAEDILSAKTICSQFSLHYKSIILIMLEDEKDPDRDAGLALFQPCWHTVTVHARWCFDPGTFLVLLFCIKYRSHFAGDDHSPGFAFRYNGIKKVVSLLPTYTKGTSVAQTYSSEFCELGVVIIARLFISRGVEDWFRELQQFRKMGECPLEYVDAFSEFFKTAANFEVFSVYINQFLQPTSGLGYSQQCEHMVLLRHTRNIWCFDPGILLLFQSGRCSGVTIYAVLVLSGSVLCVQRWDQFNAYESGKFWLWAAKMITVITLGTGDTVIFCDTYLLFSDLLSFTTKRSWRNTGFCVQLGIAMAGRIRFMMVRTEGQSQCKSDEEHMLLFSGYIIAIMAILSPHQVFDNYAFSYGQLTLSSSPSERLISIGFTYCVALGILHVDLFYTCIMELSWQRGVHCDRKVVFVCSQTDIAIFSGTKGTFISTVVINKVSFGEKSEIPELGTADLIGYGKVSVGMEGISVPIKYSLHLLSHDKLCTVRTRWCEWGSTKTRVVFLWQIAWWEFTAILQQRASNLLYRLLLSKELLKDSTQVIRCLSSQLFCGTSVEYNSTYVHN